MFFLRKITNILHRENHDNKFDNSEIANHCFVSNSDRALFPAQHLEFLEFVVSLFKSAIFVCSATKSNERMNFASMCLRFIINGLKDKKTGLPLYKVALTRHETKNWVMSGTIGKKMKLKELSMARKAKGEAAWYEPGEFVAVTWTPNEKAVYCQYSGRKLHVPTHLVFHETIVLPGMRRQADMLPLCDYTFSVLNKYTEDQVTTKAAETKTSFNTLKNVSNLNDSNLVFIGEKHHGIQPVKKSVKVTKTKMFEDDEPIDRPTKKVRWNVPIKEEPLE
jgi:TATA-box binding protein (TBP) (component of TFIID and TFIIIB)